MAGAMPVRDRPSGRASRLRSALGPTTGAIALAAALLTAGCARTGTTGTAPEGPSASPSATTTPALPPAEVVDPSTIEDWSAPLDTLILDDSFDDNRNLWKTVESGDLAVTDGAYVMTLPPGQSGGQEPQALNNGADYREVRVATEVVPHGMRAVGFDCGFDSLPDGDRYYLLMLGDQGASISKRPRGEPFVELARSSDVALVDDQEVTLEAVCIASDEEFRLGLSVDGTPVLAVIDPEPYGGGLPALQVSMKPPGEVDDQPQVSFLRYTLHGPG